MKASLPDVKRKRPPLSVSSFTLRGSFQTLEQAFVGKALVSCRFSFFSALRGLFRRFFWRLGKAFVEGGAPSQLHLSFRLHLFAFFRGLFGCFFPGACAGRCCSRRCGKRHSFCLFLSYPLTLFLSFLPSPLLTNPFPSVLNRAAWVHVLTNTFQSLFTLAYMYCSAPHNPSTWENITLSNFPSVASTVFEYKEVSTFLKLAIPGILSMSEWLYWEFICFSVGTLGVTSFAIHSIPYSLIPLHFMLPLGLSIALSVGIGHSLGSGDIRSLKKVSGKGEGGEGGRRGGWFLPFI